MQERRCRQFILLFMMWKMQHVPREYWVHPINELRYEKGEFYTLYPDLRHFPAKFFNMYRMSVAKFDALLERIEPIIRKKSTPMREPVSAKQKLVITLR